MPSDPTLYLYTSLTAGSSHIITATSRIETILKANKIPFKAVDCATDDKARMIWSRRSKGKKLPGLVKFNDVVADLEQIEEWNEYGELEDQLEDIIDIFGDVPISGTSAEAHAAAAARANAQSQSTSSQARTASETRHISITEPKEERKKSETSPMSMAMKQVGAEAAAKASQKKATPAPAAAPAAAPVDTPEDVTPETKPSGVPSTLPESAEPSTVTDAKTPSLLASEGQQKTSIDKIQLPVETNDEASSRSTLAQTLDQRRKSSVPNTPSALSKTTSVFDSHTVESSTDKESSSRTEKPRTEHRGSFLDAASPQEIRDMEKRNSIAEEDEDDDDDDEESEEDESDEEEEAETGGKKVGATDAQEKKVTGAQKTQDQKAKDEDKAGVSVGD